MKDFYVKYLEIEQKVVDASACCIANPLSRVAEDLTASIGQIKNVNVDWDDSARTSFDDATTNFSKNMQIVIDNIDFYQNCEKAYILLAEQLPILKQANEEYQTIYLDKPKESDFKKLDSTNGALVFDRSAYWAAYNNWQIIINKYETKCIEMKTAIDEWLTFLDGVGSYFWYKYTDTGILGRDFEDFKIPNFALITFDKDSLLQDHDSLTSDIDLDLVDLTELYANNPEKLEQLREILEIPTDEVIIKFAEYSINGVDFPLFFVFDSNTDPEELELIEKKMVQQAIDTLNYTSENLTNQEILEALSGLYKHSYPYEGPDYYNWRGFETEPDVFPYKGRVERWTDREKTDRTVEYYDYVLDLDYSGFRLVFDQTPSCEESGSSAYKGVLFEDPNSQGFSFGSESGFESGVSCSNGSGVIKLHYIPYLDDDLNVVDEEAQEYVNSCLLRGFGDAYADKLWDSEAYMDQFFTNGMATGEDLADMRLAEQIAAQLFEIHFSGNYESLQSLIESNDMYLELANEIFKSLESHGENVDWWYKILAQYNN